MLRAYNNVAVPSFMYGTAWKKEATAKLMIMAIAAGFKAIDTANQLIHYQEALVGEALKSLQQQGTKRNSLFLQTKFTPAGGQDHRTPYDPTADLTTQVQQSFASSLAHLATDYVDSYVLHAPFSRRGLGGADSRSYGANLQSSFTSVLSSALEYSSRLPVSVLVRFPARFSWLTFRGYRDLKRPEAI